MHMALLGAGQLGGSFALALRASNQVHITAYDVVEQNARILLETGAIDAVATSVAEAVAHADIIVIATPMRSYRALAEAIAPHIAPGTIITDLGSVKNTMDAMAHLLPTARLVPGHPIAGSEKSGPAVANADLFRGKLCILTPPPNTDAEALTIVETLWHIAGADVIAMPATVHDHIYAYVSHLPHYIAFVAASYFYQQGVVIRDDDAILQQFLRISRSNPRMWTDVALENREALLPALATYIALLEHFASELRAGDPSTTPADPVALTGRLLPRILAASLISSVSLYEQQSNTSLRPFGAGGMRDIVAPAAHTPEADTEEISHHATSMANCIDGIIPHFRTLEQHIGAEDEASLFARITNMVDDAHALAKLRH